MCDFVGDPSLHLPLPCSVFLALVDCTWFALACPSFILLDLRLGLFQPKQLTYLVFELTCLSELEHHQCHFRRVPAGLRLSRSLLFLGVSIPLTSVSDLLSTWDFLHSVWSFFLGLDLRWSQFVTIIRRLPSLFLALGMTFLCFV